MYTPLEFILSLITPLARLNGKAQQVKENGKKSKKDENNE
jgi:hypothetical protein